MVGALYSPSFDMMDNHQNDNLYAPLVYPGYGFPPLQQDISYIKQDRKGEGSDRITKHLL